MKEAKSTSKKPRIVKVAAGIFIVLVIGYLTTVVLSLWEFRQRQITLHIDSPTPLTEPQAIGLSREALKHVVENINLLEPSTYDHDVTNFYARNTLAPYNGYVLWHSLKDPNSYAYSVQLEQVGTEVRCLVGRCK